MKFIGIFEFQVFQKICNCIVIVNIFARLEQEGSYIDLEIYRYLENGSMYCVSYFTWSIENISSILPGKFKIINLPRLISNNVILGGKFKIYYFSTILKTFTTNFVPQIQNDQLHFARQIQN